MLNVHCAIEKVLLTGDHRRDTLEYHMKGMLQRASSEVLERMIHFDKISAREYDDKIIAMLAFEIIIPAAPFDSLKTLLTKLYSK